MTTLATARPGPTRTTADRSDAVDDDDDNDTCDDLDHDVLEETTATPSDWDHDNDGIPDEDDKMPTYITLDLPDTFAGLTRVPLAIFSGHVD